MPRRRGGLGGPRSKQLKSIGIDLEHAERLIKPGIMEKYMDPVDSSQSGLSPLQIWCAKEAIFKAVAPLLEKQLLLKKYA